MTKQETRVLTPEPSQVIELMRDHFDGLVRQNLLELYGASSPDELTGRELEAFEVAEDDAVAADNLMKVWFAAHARGHLVKQSMGSVVSGNESSQLMILKTHRRMGILEPPKSFQVVPGGRDLSPYQEMVSRLRTTRGDSIKHPRGTVHAARILVGNVVLTEPDYSAAHPDAAVRKLAKAAFLR